MNAEIIAALNALLEEERATVDALVALVSMATDSVERQALTAMGGQAVQGCIDLREHLERLEAPIGQRVSPSIGRILSPEHLDDRLRAFSALQLALAHRCDQLRETADLDPETYALLSRLRDVQQAHALWSERRAEEFAASRPEPDPALAAFSADASNPRGERPWSVPLPERRAHLTPRFAATPPAFTRDPRASSDHNAPVPLTASPRTDDESAPPPRDIPGSRDPRDTYNANGSATRATAPDEASAGERSIAAASTGVAAAEPAATHIPTDEETAFDSPAALPEAIPLASDELPATDAAMNATEPDPTTRPAPRVSKPRAATKPRVPRTRTTPAKTKPRPSA